MAFLHTAVYVLQWGYTASHAWPPQNDKKKRGTNNLQFQRNMVDNFLKSQESREASV